MSRNYRIVRIAGLHYTTPMKMFYQKDKDLKHAPYEQQQKKLFECAFTYSDSFSKGMRALGHDAHEIVYDLEIMQKKWAKENGVSYSIEGWQHEIVIAQLIKLKPDIVYFQDILSMSAEVRRTLKKVCPSIKLIVIFRGFPGVDQELLKNLPIADVLITGSPVLQKRYQELGYQAHQIYHSFDPTVLEKISEPSIYDFTFIGSSGLRYGLDQQKRYWFLVDLLEKTQLQLFVDELGQHDYKTPVGHVKAASRSFLKQVFGALPIELVRKCDGKVQGKIGRLLKEIVMEEQVLIQEGEFHSHKQTAIPSKSLQELYPDRANESAFGLDMYRLLQRSKITFNRHSTPAQGTVDNIRLFHATGVGAALLTDRGSNMHEIFEEDREVVTYSSVEECIEKVTFLLKNEPIREQIAKAGQARTLKEHTVYNRCRQLDDILQASF